MSRHIALATLSACAALSLAGQGLAQATVDPGSVKSGTYALETSHARVVFSLTHMGFSTWYGDFSGSTGTLNIDPKVPGAAKLDITIPTGQVTTTNAIVDRELKSPGWFDAEKYPAITFHSTSVVSTGPTTAKVTGDLTFHGVTKPVDLDVTFKGAGTNPLSRAYTVGFDARGSLKRSDFGVSKYVPMVGDQVELMISAPFERKGD